MTTEQRRRESLAPAAQERLLLSEAQEAEARGYQYEAATCRAAARRASEGVNAFREMHQRAAARRLP